MKLILKNFRLVDASMDTEGSLVVEDGIITSVFGKNEKGKCVFDSTAEDAYMIINGKNFITEDKNSLPVLMPAFVDLHAHFRDPGLPDETESFPQETPFPAEFLESASLAAAAGGFGTVVSMANTKPVIDTLEKAASIKSRSDILGLIDLYPVISLTRGMEGKELSGIIKLPDRGKKNQESYLPLMLSEDGKDITDDELFIAAMKEAKRAGIPISCHCDFGGEEAEAEKKAGQPRSVWSRTEEINAVRRVIELGKKTGSHIHIAHVSTKEALEMIRSAKAENTKAKKDPDAESSGFTLTCEAMPHNLALTEADAEILGKETFGRVNPPLRSEADREALICALKDGTVDAIATDHAPHSLAQKRKGAPGFSGLETAFAVINSTLVRTGRISLSGLSRLMSANPAGLIGLSATNPRGCISPGYRADLVIVDTDMPWEVSQAKLKTRGKNTPFPDRRLHGKILMTIHKGRIVFAIHP